MAAVISGEVDQPHEVYLREREKNQTGNERLSDDDLEEIIGRFD
jgi:hypothetical protein